MTTGTPTFGGGADKPATPAPTVGTPTFGGGASITDTVSVPVFVPPPKTSPSVDDGYSGAETWTRDTRGLSGGIRGYVNTATFTHSITGKDLKAFEWNALMLLDNYADAGENCGAYIQANKHGSGPTFGLCVEACDTTPGDETGLVTVEVDQWVSGPDNGERFGLDVVVGDSRTKRGLSASDTVEATAAIRISNNNTDPHAKWTTGLLVTGNVGTGIDTRKSNTKVAIQVGLLQSIKAGPINLLWLVYGSFVMSAAALAKVLL